MSGFAFNWTGVAYNTGKPNRTQGQVIRVVLNTKIMKPPYDLASFMLQPPIFSGEDFPVPDAEEEELGVVVGELLPQDFEYNYPANSSNTQFFDFAGRQDLIVPTQGRVGYVIETISGSTRRCFLLCDERINGVRVVKRLGGLDWTAIRDRLFYYREFSTCETRTKRRRWRVFQENIKSFRQQYLERRNIHT